VPEEPGIGAVAITSKYLVKLKAYANSSGDAEINQEALQEEIDYLDMAAKTRVDRLRVAIVVGELLGPEVASNRLSILKDEASPGGELAREAEILHAWYGSLAAKKDSKVSEDEKAWISERHPWFGALAFSYGKPMSDEGRWEVTSGFERFASFSGVMGVINFLALLAGGVLLVGALALTVSGSIAFGDHEPTAPAHIYYEAFGVFCFLFLLVLTVAIFTIGETGGWVVVLDQAALWCSMFAIAWPRLRGISLMEWADDMGFNKGQGWRKELTIGFAAFLISMPLELVVGLLVSALLPEKPEDPFGVPMFEQPLSSSWVMLLLGTLGASVWAPLLEEVMFRGTLMTALRTRFNPFLAALLTAVVFGIYHPYGWAGIIPVAVGGFVYGLTRLWRGSLIAPIFAHFLWNTLIGVSEVGTIALLN
jgi:membrane protease YdiL (CAAX protease family)